MPRVPVLPGPEETPRPLPGPYQSIPIPPGLGQEGARLSRLGAAIDGFGESAGALLARRAAEMRDEDAAARATQAFTAFKAEAAPLFHDPEQGFFALPGRAAYPQLLPLTRRFAEIEKKHHQGIEDPAERRLYESLAFPWAERMSEAAARKAAQARPLWLDEASTGRLQGALDEAAIAYTDPARIDELLSSGIAELARMKARNRWDDARFKETAAGFLTLGHAGVVERMLQAGDVAGARAHFESNMSLLTEDGRRQIEGRLGAAETAARAKAEAGDLYARGLDRRGALEAAQAIDDPVLRERTAGELERLYDRAQGERKRAEQAHRDAAWQSIEEGGAVLDLAPDLRDGLDAETLSSLKAWSRATLTGEPIATDPATWSRLKAMDPTDLAADDLRRWRGHLSEEDYRDLAETRRAAGSEADGDRARVLQARVLNRAFVDRLGERGIDAASPEAADLRRQVEDDLRLHEHSTGRAPDADVIREAVSSLVGPAGDGRLIGGADDEEALLAQGSSSKPAFNLLDVVPPRPPGEKPEKPNPVIRDQKLIQSAWPDSPLSVEYRYKLQRLEADAEDKYGTKTPALGAYQFTDIALKQIKMIDDKNNFVEKYGVRSKEEFLKSPEAQEKALDDYTKENLQLLKSALKPEPGTAGKGLSDWMGKRIVGKTETFPITETGLLAAAHKEGAAAVARYLKDLESYRQRHSLPELTSNDPGFWKEVARGKKIVSRSRSDVFLAIETRARLFSNIDHKRSAGTPLSSGPALGPRP